MEQTVVWVKKKDGAYRCCVDYWKFYQVCFISIRHHCLARIKDLPNKRIIQHVNWFDGTFLRYLDGTQSFFLTIRG